MTTEEMVKELQKEPFGLLEIMALMHKAHNEGVKFGGELQRDPFTADTPKSMIEMMYEFKQNQI